MTDKPAETVQVPVKAGKPLEDPYGLALKLRAQATVLEAQAGMPDGYVRVKVEPPHGHVTYEGYTIGRDWTPVHAGKMTRLRQAAAEAGVTLTEEE